MTNTFTVIDFETAQGYRHSICQVGIVRVENGFISEEIMVPEIWIFFTSD